MLGSLLDLMLPRFCVGCGESGCGLCSSCAQPWPERITGLSVSAWAAGRYDDVLRGALLRYKERGRRDLAPVLGDYLAMAVAQLVLPPGAALVPAPSSASSVKARGYDHLGPLARRAGRRLRMPVADVLDFNRAVADSAGLGLAGRSANLAGAMGARSPRHPGQLAVVVDDIVTTGATAREACRALRVAGWTAIGFASVAFTPRAAA